MKNNTNTFIKTKFNKLNIEQQKEIIDIYKSKSPELFSKNGSTFAYNLVVLLFGLFLTFISYFLYRSATYNPILLKPFEFKGNGLELTLIFTFSLTFLSIFILSLLSFFKKKGVFNTSFGLVFLNGNNIKLFPYNIISNIEKSQLNTSLYMNGSGEISTYNTGGDNKHSFKSEKSHILVYIKNQIKNEIILFKNEELANKFYLQLNKNIQNSSNISNINLENIKIYNFNEPFTNWFILFSILLIINIFIVNYYIFTYHNKITKINLENKIFENKEHKIENLTDYKNYLKNYIELYKDGKFYNSVFIKYKNLKIKEIKEFEQKLIKSDSYKYKYYELLFEFNHYFKDNIYNKEIKLLDEDKDFKREKWLKYKKNGNNK